MTATTEPAARTLGTSADAMAPDGSEVRLLAALPAASTAHFRLHPGQVSAAHEHRTVSEIWFVLAGVGRIWLRSTSGREQLIDLQVGTSLTIPVGTVFQFRNDGTDALDVFGVTLPPWPGEDEALPRSGRWESTTT